MQQVSKKVILIGNFGVGKTSLVRRFVYQKFSEEYLTTLGVKIDKKSVEIKEKNTIANLIIWDIAGEVSQTQVPQSYYLGSHGVIYVLDITRPSTYTRIQEDLDYVKRLLPKAPICIVGNKVDLVSAQDIEKFKSSVMIPVHFLTSAKDGSNVESMFLWIASQMIG
ncbi:MAG: GTP-binding protein [Microscillaceae bacterium]|nr:GTP-binding protein [Microscillaceae bacterium]MDW8461199.1 Rab family GTPase [Cytophagales bacterium]